MVLSYRRGSEANRKFWRRTLQDGDIRDGDLEEAMRLIQEHDAIDDTVERARHYGSIAQDALAIFPETNYKAALLDAVAFSIHRMH